MNILLSINYKFFNELPYNLIEKIENMDKDKNISGFEVTTDSKTEEEYTIELAKIAKQKNYILNLHSPAYESKKQYNDYLDFCILISKIMQQKINVVLHPLDAKNLEKSKKITKKAIKQIYRYIKSKKYENYIEISIENLNNLHGNDRLKREDLVEILEQNEKLKFTYDIGHEYAEQVQSKLEDEILLERVNNIHTHTTRNNKDHYPIEAEDEKMIHITKNIVNTISKNKNYDKINVVLEYALDYMQGVTFKEKLEKYIESANIIK